MIFFVHLRSFVGRLFSVPTQMRINIFLADLFWFLRLLFLGVKRTNTPEVNKIWQNISRFSSLNKEKNYDLAELIFLHNEIFKNKHTNIIEFGTCRGGSLKLIANLIKNNSKIFSIDQFGEGVSNLIVSKNDLHYKDYSPFDYKKFENLDYKKLSQDLNKKLSSSKKKVVIINETFSQKKARALKIDKIKFSFVYVDFDLYSSTLEVLKFLKNKLEKNAIVVLDDYGGINQTGVKKAINKIGLKKSTCIETSSGQLIYINFNKY